MDYKEHIYTTASGLIYGKREDLTQPVLHIFVCSFKVKEIPNANIFDWILVQLL